MNEMKINDENLDNELSSFNEPKDDENLNKSENAPGELFSGDDDSTPKNNSPGTYEDFINDIGELSPGSVIELNRDYDFSSNNYQPFLFDVEGVTINGNNHTLYGNMYDSRIFNVTADEVSISNITFKNPNFSLENTQSHTPKGKYILGHNSAYSPVTVSGDYNELSNCIFIGTSAVNGGSLYWNGNMGKIESCTFLNSSASAFGGAIFMGGYHNKVINSLIINCDSGLSGEAVYFADDRKKISFVNCLSTDIKGWYDGKKSNLDPELFHNSYLTAVADKKLDIIPLLYKSIAIGGIFYLDNDTGYYSEYFNDTEDLIFTIYRNFTDNGILYSKGYNFKNLKEIAEVFPLMLNNSYSLDIDITKNLYVNDIDSYKTAIITTESCLEPVMKYAKQDGLENIKTKVLTINLKKGMTIDCKNTIKPDSLDSMYSM
ncbi:hypothetical protein [uncultured Methanobrevibacter sp.]|uniref:hypothetical protein n=1 Tax=uncultured Methanobrevibacter sp. TaxID=253161 RepID=UPI0025DB6F4D|nr:hypothetical protein [uncultured Methanobrevibacter sp.]